MDWSLWAELIIELGPVVVAIGLLIAFGKRICKAVRTMWVDWCFMWADRERHQRIEVMLKEITAELKPNGGASIKDQISRIEKKQDYAWSFRRAQMNASARPMAEVDEHGKLTWVNQAYVRLSGMPEKALLGSGWINVVAPDQREWMEDTWQHAVDEAREMSENVTMLAPDGHAVPVHITAHPVKADDGELFGYLAELRTLDAAHA